jgi:ABC-type oligopeptide transport system substrate-binding subunit
MRSDGTVEQVRLAKNDDWWGTRGDVTELIVKSYTSANDVDSALLGGQLDMVVGAGVLTPTQVRQYEMSRSNQFAVTHGPPLMNTIVVMNAAKAPTDNIQLRKVIMHAIDKASIVESELAGSSMVADSLFPKDAPYCNVDLTPRWDYDIEKAKLMNCPRIITDATEEAKEEKTDTGLIIGLSVGIGVLLILIIGGICFVLGQRKGYKQLAKNNANPPASSVVGVPGEQAI